MVPWWDGDRLIGYLELGEEIDHVLEGLRERFDVELLAFVDKTYLDRTGWESGMRMLGRPFAWDALPDAVLASQVATVLPLDRLDPTGHSGPVDTLQHLGTTHALFRFPLVDAGGRRVAHLVTALDITARRDDLAARILVIAGASFGSGVAVIILFWLILGRAEARHRRAEARQLQLGRILDLAHEQVLLLDASSLSVVEANRGARTELGFPDEELRTLVGPELILLNYVALLSDITEAKLESDRIRRQAHRDEVTSLPNRHLLLESLARALHARRHSDDAVAVLFLDLDGFKAINDTHGHGAGDLALKEVARRLVAALRRDDMVSRLGGDEFVILLKNAGETINAEALARKALGTFADPFDREVAHMAMGAAPVSRYSRFMLPTRRICCERPTGPCIAQRAGAKAPIAYSIPRWTGMDPDATVLEACALACVDGRRSRAQTVTE